MRRMRGAKRFTKYTEVELKGRCSRPQQIALGQLGWVIKFFRLHLTREPLYILLAKKRFKVFSRIAREHVARGTKLSKYNFAAIKVTTLRTKVL